MSAFLFLLGISLSGAGLWFICYLLSAFSRKKQAEKQGKQLKLTHLRISYLITGILGQLLYWNMAYAMIEWVAQEHYTAGINNARSIYNCAVSYQSLCKEERRAFSGTCIANYADEADPNSLQEYVQDMFSCNGCWYAVVCDEDGNIEYTLFSNREISPDELHPPEDSSKIQMLKDYFFKDKAIWYYTASKNYK